MARSSATARAALAALAAPLILLTLAGCGTDGLEVRGPAPNSTAAALTVITGCTGRGEHAPTRLVLRCSAPPTVLANLHWHGWGGRTAKASGTLVTGVCDQGDPSCGSDAIVTASNLVLGSRADQYRSLTVATGTGDDRQVTHFDVDDRGPTTR